MHSKIEILPVSLLESEKATIIELKTLAKDLKLEFGWHYLLDLSWMIRNLTLINEQKIIDAGAGTGVMQWYLANKGANVISVDRESRADLPGRFRRRFHIQGLRDSDSSSYSAVKGKRSLISLLVDFVDMLSVNVESFSEHKQKKGSGEVIIYNQNLENLEQIPDNSIDAIVAVSSLEHFPRYKLF